MNLSHYKIISIFLSIIFYPGSVLFSNTILVPDSIKTIQSALNNANTGDTILVKPGTYYENIVWPETASLKLLSVGDSTNTVIDGNKSGTVLKIYPSDPLLIDTTTVIKGFKITGGSKGGISIEDAGLKLLELQISENEKDTGVWPSWPPGCGLMIETSNSILRNVSITKNKIIGDGGRVYGVGLYIDESTVELTNIQVLENENVAINVNYNFAIGIFCEASTVTMDNVIVNANKNNEDGSGTGIHIEDSTLDANILTVTNGNGRGISIENSTVTAKYLKVNNNTRGVSCVDNSYLKLSNSEINNNISGDNWDRYYGIGIYCRNSQIDFTEVDIKDNISGDNGSWYYGGGVYCEQCSMNFFNVEITGNNMGDNGSWYYGGGIYIKYMLDTVPSTLTNVLIADNLIGKGGNYYGGAAINAGAHRLNINHCTIANNYCIDTVNVSMYSIFLGGSDSKITNSIMYNPINYREIGRSNSDLETSNSNFTTLNSYTGTDNFSLDPLFVSDSNYRLQPTSPCIDKGNLLYTTSTDIEGNPRPSPNGTKPDMGVYEEQISIPPNDFFIYNDTACFSYITPTGDETYSTSGSYFDTLKNNQGLDSILLINAEVIKIDTSLYFYNDTTIATKQLYGHQLNWLDCNNNFSVVFSTADTRHFTPQFNSNFAVEITVHGCIDTSYCLPFNYFKYDNLIIDTFCNSYTVPSGDETYYISGMFYDTLVNNSGTDSILQINLTKKIMSTLSINFDSILVDVNDANYQWLNCDSNYQLIENEVGQSFIPSIEGNYAVEIDQSGCIDTSNCIFYGLSSNEHFYINDIEILQNPTDDFIVIINNSAYHNLTIKLYDISGQFLKEAVFAKSNQQEINIDLQKGIYIISLFNKEKLIKSEKIIKI